MMLWILAAPLFAASSADYVTVVAAYTAPGRAGANGAITVMLTPKDTAVHVNEDPPPRLKLDAEQRVLVDKQPPPPSRVANADPDAAKYLDPRMPVSFPVALAPGAPKGVQTVKGNVVYFFCSKREGWCRRGSADIEVPVAIP